MPLATRRNLLLLAKSAFSPKKLPGLQMWLRTSSFAASVTTADDNFNRADAAVLGSAQTGGAWTAHSGTWGIASNRANLQDNTNLAHASLETGNADGVLACDLTLSSGALRVNMGLCFRSDGTDRLELRLFIDATNNLIELRKIVGGAATALASVTGAGLVEGTTYAAKVVMRGSNIEIWLDGTNRLNHTLSAGDATTFNARTRHGIRASRQPATQDDGGSRWDNLNFYSGFKDGDTVPEWLDLSGKAAHAVQATFGRRPLYKLNLINGLPAIRFDAVDDVLQVNTNLGMLRNVAGATGFIVAATPNSAAVKRLFKISVGGGTGVRFSFLKDAADKQALAIRRADGDGLGLLTGSTIGTGWTIWSATQSYAATTGTQWRNGTQDATSAALGTAGNTSDTDSQEITVGAGSTTGTEFTGADIAEVLIYNRVLTATERKKVEKYLGKRYGVTVA